MHSIRLRKPWTRWNDENQVVERVDVPDQGQDSIGKSSTWNYSRRFQCPATVLDQARVQISVAGWMGQMIQAKLNDQELCLEGLQGDQGCIWEVAQHLRSSNELVLTFRSDGEQACLSGEVELRIDD